MIIQELKSLDTLRNKFGTVYADPPWKYSNNVTRGAAEGHYEVMSIEDIKKLPINDITLPNSHLHLWTTKDFIFDAKDVLEAWGFEYKSMYVWIKPQLGMGNYWRVGHELLLLGVKGSLVFNLKNKRSWGLFDREKHSRKPDEIRKLIELVSPGPYIELFSRPYKEEIRKEWYVWGNEYNNATTKREREDCYQSSLFTIE